MCADRRIRGVFRSHFQQLATRHPEIGQREQCCQLCGVFPQSAVARLREAELQLDHPKRMLDLGTHACFKVFNFVDDAIKRVVFVQRRALAGAHRDHPLHCFCARTFLYPTIARIADTYVGSGSNRWGGGDVSYRYGYLIN